MMLREANFNDLRDLVNLYNQLVNYQKMLIDDSVETSYRKLLSLSNYHIFVATVEEQVVSTCTLIIVPNLTHHQRPYAIIENVVTDSNWRGLGYASNLLKYAKQIARQENCHKILLQTRSPKDEVLNFYRKNGFTDKETTGFQINIEWDEENGKSWTKNC